MGGSLPRRPGPLTRIFWAALVVAPATALTERFVYDVRRAEARRDAPREASRACQRDLTVRAGLGLAPDGFVGGERSGLWARSLTFNEAVGGQGRGLRVL